jgi:hypothetical protein
VMRTGDVSLDAVTVAGNSAGADGATTGGPGAHAAGGGLAGSGQFAVRATALAQNTPTNCQTSAAIENRGFNLDFPGSFCPGATADPVLGALLDNGGPTLTRLPGANGAAVDAIPAVSGACRSVDQRGIARPQGGGCDIGAVLRATKPGGGGNPLRGDDGGAGPPGGDDGGGGGGDPAADEEAPDGALWAIRRSLRAALSRGLVVRAATDEPARATVEVLARRAALKRPNPRRRVRIARGLHQFASAGQARIAARFKRSAKAKLGDARRLRVVVRLSLIDAAGNRATTTVRVTLRR